MKTVYLFYLSDEKVIKELGENNLLQNSLISSYSDNPNYFFYGYTDDKTTAAVFLSMRKQDVFYMKKIKMTESDFNDLDSMFYSFNKIAYESLKISDKQSILIPITSGEEWYVCEYPSETMYEYIKTNIHIFSPEIFSEKMREALIALQYFQFEYLMEDLDFDFSEKRLIRVLEFVKRNAWSNELGILAFLYRPIISIDDIIERGEIIYG